MIVRDSVGIAEPLRTVARTTGMTPAPDPDAELAAPRAEVAHLRQVNQELLGTVAELRTTVEQQQAHIDRLVRMTFGRKSERITGTTLPIPTRHFHRLIHLSYPTPARIRSLEAAWARSPPADRPTYRGSG